jgi:hypothetical protein
MVAPRARRLTKSLALDYLTLGRVLATELNIQDAHGHDTHQILRKEGSVQ